jgi:hypothetical protein
MSACTLVVNYIPKERLCFDANAQLAFHMLRSGATADWKPGDPWKELPLNLEATKQIVDSFPEDIRNWINERGGYSKLPTETYLTMRASELWKMGYRRCAKSQLKHFVE